MAQLLVAYAYGLDIATLRRRGPGSEAVTFARQVAMYLAHVCHKQPTRRVGHAFGRDHKTVLHACRRVEDAREDPKFNRTLQWLETLLNRSLGQPA